MFTIIIPNFNSEEWIKKCLNSLLIQSWELFNVVIIDDMSTDNSIEIIKEYCQKDKRITLIEPNKKLWNGGARNVGIDFAKKIKSQYILYLDDDDWLYSIDGLKDLANTIIANNYPDCIRLPYIHYKNGVSQEIRLGDNNPKDLVNSCFVAPWTKCIKTEIAAYFPENTLIEDVVQHIEQCDKIETVAVCETPIVVWNRDNVMSTSLEENKFLYNAKRISSVYRNIADLMDLQCEHDYCEEHRKWRIECYKNIVREGKEEHF